MSLSAPVFRPPSEAGNVIIQVNEGCPHNSCQFCGMYKTKPYREKTLEDIIKDIDSLPEYILSNSRRVFLADGDAMQVGPEKLPAIVDHINTRFTSLERISAYATCRSINQYQTELLKELNKKRLKLFYMGLESGDEELLEFCGKSMRISEYKKASDLIHQAGSRISLTAILGLGGRRFTEQHAIRTAEAVNIIRPRYFSLLTLIFGGNEKYIDRIIPLTSREIFQEMKKIVKNIEVRTIFRSNHVSNLYPIGGNLPRDRDLIINSLDCILNDPGGRYSLDRVPQFDGENSY